MKQSLQVAASLRRGFPSQCPRCSSVQFAFTSQRRNFTTTPRSSRGAQAGPDMSRKLQSRMGESQGSKMKGLRKSQIPTDLGLFPGTYVAGRWRDQLPLARKKFMLWLQWSGKRLILPTAAMIRNWYTTRGIRGKWMTRNTPSVVPIQKLPLDLTNRVQVALDLHRGFNEAVARGDKQWLQQNACKGLCDESTNLINERERRNPNSLLNWSRENPRGRTSKVLPWPLQILLPPAFRTYRIDTDTIAALPMAPDALLRQLVVRITSVQRFDLCDGLGEQTKDMEEYVVVHQLIWEGKPDKWRIWGTLQPVTEKKLVEHLTKSKEARAKEGDWMDRVKAQMPAKFQANMPF